MARNAEVIRQWSLLKAVEASRHVTIPALAEQLGVTTRTIRRDLEALQAAGFPLYDVPSDSDGRKIWRLDPRPLGGLGDASLTLSELCALYFSRTVLECLAGAPFHDHLTSAFGKIERVLPPKMRQFLDRLPAIVQAKSTPTASRGAAGQDATLVRVIDAILGRRRLGMQYHSFSSHRTKEYVVEPQRLIYADGGIYLLAHVPDYGAARTFALQRIAKIALLDTTFVATDASDEAPFPHSLGVNQGTPEQIEIEFAAPVAPYVCEREWHRSQTITRAGDGSVLMSLDVCNDSSLRRWILSFGPLAKVRAPAQLAARIQSELDRALGQYAGDA